MTDDERQLARERVAQWPLADRRSLVKLPPAEVEVIGLLVALLDARPSDTSVKSTAACGTMRP